MIYNLLDASGREPDGSLLSRTAPTKRCRVGDGRPGRAHETLNPEGDRRCQSLVGGRLALGTRCACGDWFTAEDGLDRALLGLRFALDLGSHRLGPGEDLRVGLASHDPGLEGDPDLLGDDALKDQAGSQRQLREQIQGQIARLQTRADNLIDLVADGGLAGSKAREKITEIERERAGLEVRLGTIEDDLSIGADFIKGWLELLRDPYELYRNASNDMRRELNQAIFKTAPSPSCRNPSAFSSKHKPSGPHRSASELTSRQTKTTPKHRSILEQLEKTD
jgi:hypothetical protein